MGTTGRINKSPLWPESKREYGTGKSGMSKCESNDNKRAQRGEKLKSLFSTHIVSLPLTLKLTPLSPILVSLFPSSFYF